MKILRLFTTIVISLILVLPAEAQLGKEMKAFRDKQGVTVTMLAPSLYSLYKKDNLSLKAEEMLKGIREINVLRVDRKQAESALVEEVNRRMASMLTDESKYRLVKSGQHAMGSECLYVTETGDKVTSLVVWVEESHAMTVIELKGEIWLEEIPELADAFNIKGFEYLAYIDVLNENEENPLDFGQEYLNKLLERLQHGFIGSRDSSFMQRFFSDSDDVFEGMHAIFQKMEEMMKNMGDPFGRMQDLSGLDGFTESMSNGLEVIQENGKTRIKVNAKNTDVVYLIDGEEFSADSINGRIPEDIVTVNMVTVPGHPETSYVVINTNKKAGQFVRYSDGVLKFKHEDQEYTYNVEKLSEPMIIVNNRLTRRFNVDPLDIIQIRPVSEVETRVLGYPAGGVVIVTRETNFLF